MLIWCDARATAEAAAGPSPLAFEMLRALRDLSRAESQMQDAHGYAGAVLLDLTTQQARAELEVAVGRFCSEPRAASRVS